LADEDLKARMREIVAPAEAIFLDAKSEAELVELGDDEEAEAMRAEMKKALTSDDLVKAWNGLGAETPNLYGDAFGKFVNGEIKRWADVVKASGAKLD
jgi:hypothetical protein